MNFSHHVSFKRPPAFCLNDWPVMLSFIAVPPRVESDADRVGSIASLSRLGPCLWIWPDPLLPLTSDADNLTVSGTISGQGWVID
ncbi:hypothetical protein KFZ76_06885 [Methylovulum psychrotolerans]|uniref:hypothetical protein n=1 Tax=Methylovulum psychrotolerans TaxID=1704499 RepID=UPI001BFFAA78|nr:hypothetical protein [Methylovulum psychrotolerans]MBT9097435.1 hypothetical protein [Methylovulum psychrotolerans]